MVSRVATVAFDGVDIRMVDVQVQAVAGLPAFTIVGLADKAVAESRERIRAALSAVGLALPPKRITVNLAPADMPKEGSHYDLPIALAVMAAIGAIASDAVSAYVVIGELALDGSISHVAGALPAAMGANASGKGLICPDACGSEAAWASADMDILAPKSLLSLINHFNGCQVMTAPEPKLADDVRHTPDLADIKGQESAKRALEIAAVGGHNIIFNGPPGSGKSMLAQRLPGILPPLSPAEMLEVSMVYSVAGLLPEGRLSPQRPYRSPHHSASMAAMVGGGVKAKPGEVSLAHMGVLFLDELPEFSAPVLDSLRQPLESGNAVIARANHRISYPACFQLVAAMNPCRCGLAGTPGYSCRRGKRCAADYQARISGPLLDRIDLRLAVAAVRAADLILPPPSEGSAEVVTRVCAARRRQTLRFERFDHGQNWTNATCPSNLVEEMAAVDEAGLQLLRGASDKMHLTARGYHRILRVGRSIADLAGHENVSRAHLAEALSFRGDFTGAILAA